MATTTTSKSRAARGAAANKPEPAAKPEKKETVQQLKNRLRNEAEREVLDLHKPEVIKRTEAKYKAHGLEYVRRLTDEEKAAKEIEEHFKRYPHLRTQFTPAVEQQQAQAEKPYPGYLDYANDGRKAGETPAEDYADVEPEEGLGYVAENGE